jgi:hypothetical protein
LAAHTLVFGWSGLVLGYAGRKYIRYLYCILRYFWKRFTELKICKRGKHFAGHALIFYALLLLLYALTPFPFALVDVLDFNSYRLATWHSFLSISIRKYTPRVSGSAHP